jgi:hypothetical protein
MNYELEEVRRLKLEVEWCFGCVLVERVPGER